MEERFVVDAWSGWHKASSGYRRVSVGRTSKRLLSELGSACCHPLLASRVPSLGVISDASDCLSNPTDAGLCSDSLEFSPQNRMGGCGGKGDKASRSKHGEVPARLGEPGTQHFG
jgi:hypothetical protein